MKNGLKISMILILQIVHFSVQSSREHPEVKLARLNAERRNLETEINRLRSRLEYMQTDAYLQNKVAYYGKRGYTYREVRNRVVPQHISETNYRIKRHNDRMQSLNEEIGNTELELINLQRRTRRLETQTRSESNNRERQNLLTQILSLRSDLQENHTELLSLKSDMQEIQTKLLSLKSDINNSKNYTQDHIREKIIQLLQSDTLCSAIKGCRRKKNKLTVDEITKALFTETETQPESTPARNPEKPAVTSQGDR